ncbi:hypothetical protein EBO15_26115 [Actinomadura harenae]|uniref:Uncharacterized protein n=2 Tax=Actinomadura harenae TaxID=2483351 RepID=A0A3M2LVN2_9ACTN|nr:hypothetical protein EBO15_26115 [Actinomadura harenae]
MALPANALPAESAPARKARGPVPLPKANGTFQHGRVGISSNPEARTRRPHKVAAAGERVLKVNLLDRDGETPSTERGPIAFAWPLNGDDGIPLEVVNGHAEGPVPDGDYIVDSRIHDTAPNGRSTSVLLYKPKVSVSADTTVTLDGRTARPVRVESDRAGAASLSTVAAISQRLGGRYRAVALLLGDDNYVTPAAPGDDLQLDITAQLTKGGAAEGSPYVYNISSSLKGIPADPTVRVRTADLAEVRTRHASSGGRSCANRQSFPVWATNVELSLNNKVGALPAERTEYFTPGMDWGVDSSIVDASCVFEQRDYLMRKERFPHPGQYARTWGQGPFGPGQGTFTPNSDGQNLIQVPLMNSADAETLVASSPFTQGDTKLTDASGSVVALSGIPGYLDGWEPAKPGKYTLTVNAKRSASWSDLSSQQHITWNVKVTDQKATLPLGVVRYKVPGLDAGNRAPANSLQTVNLTPDGLTTGTTPKVWTSTDDGTTWKPAPVIKDGTGWKAAFRNPAKGYVSLRTQVNGIVDQTLIRAYGVR